MQVVCFLDGMAMIQGLLQADSLGIQTARHPDLVKLFLDMNTATVTFGARLMAILQAEGWEVVAPAYPMQPTE